MVRALPDGSLPVPCCIEAPPAFRRKAQYALLMLLGPLGIDPRWVNRSGLEAGGLYYGETPEAAPATATVVRLLPETVTYFASGEAFDPGRAEWFEYDAQRWPLLFGSREEPDWIASSFFWLSGWQEHTTHARDAHGRFPHAASLQAALGTTCRPVVDACRERLGQALGAAGLAARRRRWGTAEWVLCPTHDIDYLHKWRAGMIYREVVPYLLGNARREAVPTRLRRLGRFVRDWLRPGDPYREALVRMHDEVVRRGGTATYFLKAGAHGLYDVAYDLEDALLRRLLERWQADGFEVGLHPSYYAHTHAFYLHEEKHRLEKRLGREVTSVRQHYLRYESPATPRLQDGEGFRIDSTLGFAEHEGFRHGTCLPFQPYDCVADAPIELWEMPLSVMESALFNRRGLSPGEAEDVTRYVLDAVRRFGGAAVMLWHNTLWDEMDHPGWGRHFTETLDQAGAGGARIASLQGALSDWLGTSV